MIRICVFVGQYPLCQYDRKIFIENKLFFYINSFIRFVYLRFESIVTINFTVFAALITYVSLQGISRLTDDNQKY